MGKHNNTMGDLGEQIDSINKNKAKSEKDKAGMERDLQEARVGLEEAMRDRANMEKNCKMTQGLIAESNTKLDELARALNEADSTKKKLQIESQDLTRQIEETEAAIGNLGKNKISLQTQLEDTKKLADGEARDRASLLTKYKALLTDCENFKMKIEEEAEKIMTCFAFCLKLRLRFSYGNQSLRLKPWDALMNWKVVVPSFQLELQNRRKLLTL